MNRAMGKANGCADWPRVWSAAQECGFELEINTKCEKHSAWVRAKSGVGDSRVADLNLLAILTGLSTATISKALRGVGHVADEKRVRCLAEALGYRSRTRLPKRWRGKDVAVATEFLGKPSFSYHEDILRSITHALDRRDGRLILFDLSDRWTRLRFFADPPNLAECEGLILVNTQATADELSAFARTYPTLPVVLVHDNRPKNGDLPAPVVANIFPAIASEDSGYRLLIRHVLEKHNSKFPVLVMVAPNAVETRLIKQQVFNEECDRLKITPNVYADLPEYTVAAGVALVHQVNIRFGQRVDALICLSDAVAVGARSQLGACSDILVSGFDNNELAKAFGISSVDQGLAETGARAISALERGIRTWREIGVRTCEQHEVPVLPAIRCCQDS